MNSFACIGAYTIDTNTDQLLTVSHANWESLIHYISTKDDVKESDPNYATLAKIRRMDPFVPGTYVLSDKLLMNRQLEYEFHSRFHYLTS